jgi:hypothetical protein
MPALAADPASSLPWRRARHQLKIEPLCASLPRAEPASYAFFSRALAYALANASS